MVCYYIDHIYRFYSASYELFHSFLCFLKSQQCIAMHLQYVNKFIHIY